MKLEKKDLAPEVIALTTENAHLAILDGLTKSRQWASSKIKFQGGTSLRLVYGSPRFSEDLDFVAPKNFDAGPLIDSAKSALLAAMRRIEPSAEVSLKVRTNEKNPRVFNFTISSPTWYRSIRVKLEFWETADAIIDGYQSELRTANVREPANPSANLFNQISPIALDTATINEIFTDKLYAIAGREYVKVRDFFDIWHIRKNLLDPRFTVEAAADLATAAFKNRAGMYPDSIGDLPGFAELLQAKTAGVLTTINDAQKCKPLIDEMERWLPVSMHSNIKAIMLDAATFANQAAGILAERCKSGPAV